MNKGNVDKPNKQDTQAAKKPVQSTKPALETAVSNPYLQLQRTIGNQALGRLYIQRKMTVGPVGDHYEQEADAVAKQVVSTLHSPQTQAAASPTVQRQEEEEEVQLKPLPSISALQRQEEEEEVQMKPLVQRQEEEEEVQMKRDPMLAGGELNNDVESAVQSAKTGGNPLGDNIRGSMEQAFGADFSGVKIHTGGQADTLNRSLSARAFTTGQDIFFRQGEYNPGSSGGQELLAHELTHVVQQSDNAVQRAPNISSTLPAVIQRADWYEYGAGNVTPHIHAYSGGDCHLKDAFGSRFDLIKKGRRVKQARINEAYDAIREQFPDATNTVRVAVLAKMSELLRGVPKDKSEE